MRLGYPGITEFYIHPEWNIAPLANDIALVKLPENVIFNGNRN